MKPILVCYLPFANEMDCIEIKKQISKEVGKDYYVLVLSSEKYNNIQFELINGANSKEQENE